MSAPADAIGKASSAATDNPARPAPFRWSLRREIWENRSLWLAPLIVAGVVLLGYLIAGIRIITFASIKVNGFSTGLAAVAGIAFIQFVILATALIVAASYCLGALYNERRDRSILFWKSMPVSDLTAVGAKAVVPLVILPLITLVVGFVAGV
ncbi:MAG: hypothetical protein ACREEX_15495, partial [Caulobacteraceae bacterium]